MRSDVVVIGGGVIGTTTAWRLAQHGRSVVVADPDPTGGAWHTAAGMLAPVSELHVTETPLLRLNLAGLARWPAFAAELHAAAGTDLGYRESGTAVVAWDAADLRALQDVHALAREHGLDARWLTGRELRELEPDLAAGLPGGLLAPGDHQVDPRRLHAALVHAAARAGVLTLRGRATLETGGGRVTGVRIEHDGTIAAVDTATVVVAAGAWSATIDGLPADAVPPVRPVKGQTLRLRLPGAPRLRHVVRATVKGSPVYLVPRDNGELVVGASSEDAGYNRTPRAGAVYELLRDAQSLLPELAEATFGEVSTGLRPGTPDNAPIVGTTTLDGLVHATGHYRNGVLLTPLTADAVAELICTGHPPEEIAPFGPARFDVPVGRAALS